MIFEQLTEKEKAYWLNYLIRMEALYQEKMEQLEAKKNQINSKKWALLVEANQFYQDTYAAIKEDLYPIVSKEALTARETIDFSYNNTDLLSYEYLIRDWGKHTNGYDQYQLIYTFLEKRLQELQILNANKALFLGCGTGRYAVDLAYRYQQVEALDASLFMIWSIKRLQELRDWEVLRRENRNCRTIEDVVERGQLHMTAEQAAVIEDKVHFFVGNASNIGLEEQSINHIYSIYFTDVLSLSTLFGEVHRLLKNSGLFIHFGPLEYFFNEEEQMLTAEEVRWFFEEQGYTILVDEYLETRHLYSPNSMRYRVYDNWFFIAQKPQIEAPKTLKLSSVLNLNDAISLETLAVVERGQCVEIEQLVQLGQASYNLPEIIYEFLLEIDGEQTIEQILTKLKIHDLIAEEQAQFMAILQELLTAKMIQLKSNKTDDHD